MFSACWLMTIMVLDALLRIWEADPEKVALADLVSLILRFGAPKFAHRQTRRLTKC